MLLNIIIMKKVKYKTNSCDIVMSVKYTIFCRSVDIKKI